MQYFGMDLNHLRILDQGKDEVIVQLVEYKDLSYLKEEDDATMTKSMLYHITNLI